ncbi:MAG: hypothetical protein RBS57_16390 [Desulforhabdus sp.]|jgi:hypothetical protein|nr:hypothetical protein [Desulforhabdus sp.]
MNGKAWFVGFIFIALFMAFSTPVSGDELNARLIPGGTVSMIADGKQVHQFKSEVPLPDGLLMVGEGSCVVQTKGLQLMVSDRSIFALAEGEKNWDLTVKKGHVDFVLRTNAKPITFSTPHDVIESRQSMVKASSAGLVRGYIEVTEDETKLVVTEGALQASSAKGNQVIEEGRGIRLAIADPPGASSPPVGGGAKPPAPAGAGPKWMPFAALGTVGAGGGMGAFLATQSGGDEISPP